MVKSGHSTSELQPTILLMSSVPQEPATELKSLQAYRKQSLSGCACLLCDYATQEVAKEERVVVLDEVNGWVAVVPWWATWPFEIMGGYCE